MKNIAIKPEDYTILAVDDIATNIMLLKAVLSRAKYKIVTASGGNEALEKAAKESPDLILLDIMMPDMDGYEVIRHLKADPALQDIPVIFLTALLTGIGVFDSFAKHAGAGTLVPITGFANAVVAPAMEFKQEGLVTGTAAKLFTVAGPVLVYGISASVLYGLILWLIQVL